MFEGIRNFQKEKGLTIDGVMKPEGETENKINELLKQKSTQKNNSIFGQCNAEQQYSLTKKISCVKP